jgi:signal transduction histidine kinase
VNNFGWTLGILPVTFILPLVFPDGTLPSRRWRPFLWSIFAFVGLLNLEFIVGQPTLSGSNEALSVANPLYVSAAGNMSKLDPVIGLLLLGVFALSVASTLLRFRRAVGVQRQQIKWVAFGLLAAFLAIVVSSFIEEGLLGAILGGAGFLIFPLTIGIAVLRFHLYDLDVVVRKTVVYAALAVFATVVYLALVVGLGAWLGRGSSFLTMVAAVIVALSFQPARQWITHVANRLVYGRRATPYEVLSEFSERVGGTYATEDVLPRMARVLAEGTGAERATVWIKVGDVLRPAAVWPSDLGRPEELRLTNGELPLLPDADVALPVRHHDELLGALAVRKAASEPPTPAEEKLVADLAAQAGLVLRNERLTGELRARLDELQAAQKRIVAAQDEGRRRLERNIHDGAQQQLVALAVKARLAQGLVDRDPAKAGEILGQIAAETQDALEDLRDLARGIYPPLLADQGLVAAVEAQARKATLTVEVEAAGLGRYPQEVEAAAYFSVLESLQNAAKHARAGSVTVRLERVDGSLAFEVSDDGVGFDPRSTGFGSGLQGITDRLAALGGDLVVRSEPGRGTTLIGRLPVEVVDAGPRDVAEVTA